MEIFASQYPTFPELLEEASRRMLIMLTFGVAGFIIVGGAFVLWNDIRNGSKVVVKQVRRFLRWLLRQDRDA